MLRELGRVLRQYLKISRVESDRILKLLEELGPLTSSFRNSPESHRGRLGGRMRSAISKKSSGFNRGGSGKQEPLP